MVTNAIANGTVTVSNGKPTRSTSHGNDVSTLQINLKRVLRLLRNVMPIIGKLVQSVKTGNSAKKYCTTTHVVIGLLVDEAASGPKLSVYKS